MISLCNLTVEDLELANQIIKHAEIELGYSFNDSILLALADHLSLALKRAKEHLYFGTPLEWDIKLIYPNEFRYATRCVKMINETMDLDIPDQEASFIALHLINASANAKDMDETVLTTKIIQNILNIVRRYYRKDFDEDNLMYHVLLYIFDICSKTNQWRCNQCRYKYCQNCCAKISTGL